MLCSIELRSGLKMILLIHCDNFLLCPPPTKEAKITFVNRQPSATTTTPSGDSFDQGTNSIYRGLNLTDCTIGKLGQDL